jgi:serine/threonine protein kinase
VAVKLFHSVDVGIDIDDARKLLLLKHQHIAAVLDVGRTGFQIFTATEYLSGGTLKDHIRSMNSVGSRQAAVRKKIAPIKS